MYLWFNGLWPAITPSRARCVLAPTVERNTQVARR